MAYIPPSPPPHSPPGTGITGNGRIIVGDAKQVIKKSQSFRRPKEKLEFQSKIQTSYRDLLKALKEENNEPLTILDRIDTKIKERKNG